jgi:hypothetical protein
MANFPSKLYTGQSGTAGASLNAAAGFPVAKNALGKLRIVQVPYAMAGTEAANDLIQLTILKNGSRVLAALSRLEAANAALTCTVAVGDSSNTGRYANGLVLSNTNADLGFNTNPGTDAYVPTDIVVANPPTSASDQTVVLAKLLTLGTPNAGAKLLFLIAVVDE